METFGIRVYKEYFNFAAAHFLLFEDGTREELHGHNYQVRIQIEGTLGDDTDVFIDFLHIKPIVKAACDRIDHKTLLPQFSKLLTVTRNETSVEAVYNLTGERWVIPGRDVIILPIPNTSVERLGQYLCMATLQDLKQQYPAAEISRVEFEVEESRGQCAIYRLEYATPKRLDSIESQQSLVLS